MSASAPVSGSVAAEWSQRGEPKSREIEPREWTSIHKELDRALGDPRAAERKAAVAALTSRPESQAALEEQVNELFDESPSLFEPVDQNLASIGAILASDNDWRNIVEFLGAFVDFRVDYACLQVKRMLSGLLHHKSDYVFLAAAQALVAADLLDDELLSRLEGDRRAAAMKFSYKIPK